MFGTRLGSVLMAGVGIAHLIPAAAMMSRGRVEDVYGITVRDSDTELLLRHRATFFGLLGVGLIVGAVDSRYRLATLTSGALSLGSFVVLANTIGTSNNALTRVTRVDIGLLSALVAAALTSTRRQQVPEATE
ncbi:hypothetical protein [Rhodococcus artemisiae]|uniref:Phosphopantetheine adenylyltransferase n=1 Tax=Rhodococcus artemisiae TaxID=714159 RepID=A0ABU7LBD5_9NOCA|nr:hypothetical protein [Rhodococcus artemisiae]MEE2058227.1 hypothetical protein [Rhodococcus artemisiae]